MPRFPTATATNWLRLANAPAGAICIALALDVGDLAPYALVGLAAALAVFLLALAALDGLTELFRTRRGLLSTFGHASVPILAIPPIVYGGWRWWNSRDALPWWAPFILVITPCLLGVGSLRMRIAERSDVPAEIIGRTVAGVWLVAALLFLHRDEGTLSLVRPGTGALHLALFSGTWLLTGIAIIIVGARGSLAWPMTRGRRIALAATCLITGVILLATDRYVLAGLYPGVHAWLGLLTLVFLDTGLRCGAVASSSRRWLVTGALATVVLTAGGALALVRAHDVGSLMVRNELKGSPLGTSLLHLLPARRGDREGPRRPAHPALHYAQYLDLPKPQIRQNILLVTVDALRQDVVNKSYVLPNVAAFRGQSVAFERAYAQGSRTAIAMSSLMLGRYGANISWDLWIYLGGGKLQEPNGGSLPRGGFVLTTVPIFRPPGTLAERLQKAGYHTLAVPYAGANEFFRRGVGFERGFDVFDDMTGETWKPPTSARVVERALRHLDGLRHREPWFCWIHFYDPHEARGHKGRYQQLLRAFDASFGQLIEWLKRAALEDSTAVVVLADHGEALGEHGHREHASSLYDEQVRVPLLIRLPGVEPRLENQVVAAIDATATILSIGGANTSHLDGVNLLPLLHRGAYPVGRPVFTELHRYLDQGRRTTDLKGVVLDSQKLILDRIAGTQELYDLKNDPHEQRNLVSDHPEGANALLSILESFLDQGERDHPLP